MMEMVYDGVVATHNHPCRKRVGRCMQAATACATIICPQHILQCTMPSEVSSKHRYVPRWLCSDDASSSHWLMDVAIGSKSTNSFLLFSTLQRSDISFPSTSEEYLRKHTHSFMVLHFHCAATRCPRPVDLQGLPSTAYPQPHDVPSLLRSDHTSSSQEPPCKPSRVRECIQLIQSIHFEGTILTISSPLTSSQSHPKPKASLRVLPNLSSPSKQISSCLSSPPLTSHPLTINIITTLQR